MTACSGDFWPGFGLWFMEADSRISVKDYSAGGLLLFAKDRPFARTHLGAMNYTLLHFSPCPPRSNNSAPAFTLFAVTPFTLMLPLV
jgi:hypothetical protein